MTLTLNHRIASACMALGLIVCSMGFLTAQVEVNSTLTPEQYVNDVLLGTGVEATNVVFT